MQLATGPAQTPATILGKSQFNYFRADSEYSLLGLVQRLHHTSNFFPPANDELTLLQ